MPAIRLHKLHNFLTITESSGHTGIDTNNYYDTTNGPTSIGCMLVMFLLSSIYHCYRWAIVKTAQNRTFLLEKAEWFSCTYYCLF